MHGKLRSLLVKVVKAKAKREAEAAAGAFTFSRGSEDDVATGGPTGGDADRGRSGSKGRRPSLGARAASNLAANLIGDEVHIWRTRGCVGCKPLARDGCSCLNQSTNPPNNQPTDQPINDPTNRPTNQLTNQPTNQPIN